MRKVDYDKLAFVFSHEITTARQIIANRKGDTGDTLRALGAIAALSNAAEQFAYVASVDRTKFLIACGIV